MLGLQGRSRCPGRRRRPRGAATGPSCTRAGTVTPHDPTAEGLWARRFQAVHTEDGLAAPAPPDPRVPVRATFRTRAGPSDSGAPAVMVSPTLTRALACAHTHPNATAASLLRPWRPDHGPAVEGHGQRPARQAPGHGRSELSLELASHPSCESTLGAVPDSQRGCGRSGRSPPFPTGRSTPVAPALPGDPDATPTRAAAPSPGPGQHLPRGARAAASGRPRLPVCGSERRAAGPVRGGGQSGHRRPGARPLGVLRAAPSRTAGSAQRAIYSLCLFSSAASVPESRPPRGGATPTPAPEAPPCPTQRPARQSLPPRQVSCQGRASRAGGQSVQGRSCGRTRQEVHSGPGRAAGLRPRPACLEGPQGPQHRPVQGRRPAPAVCCRPSAAGPGAWGAGPCLLGARRASAQAPQTGGRGDRPFPAAQPPGATSHAEGPWRSATRPNPPPVGHHGKQSHRVTACPGGDWLLCPVPGDLPL